MAFQSTTYAAMVHSLDDAVEACLMLSMLKALLMKQSSFFIQIMVGIHCGLEEIAASEENISRRLQAITTSWWQKN